MHLYIYIYIYIFVFFFFVFSCLLYTRTSPKTLFRGSEGARLEAPKERVEGV